MSWSDVAQGATAVGTALVERNWAKRDTVTDQDFEREQVAQQQEFQTTSATTKHLRDKAAAKRAVVRDRATHGSRYQRSMADMKKAGLNPMLAYQQGAGSSPGAASPSGVAPGGAKGSARGTKPTSIDILGAVQRGSQARLNTQNIEVAKANIRNIDSQTELNSAKALQVGKQIPKIEAETVGQITENEIRALKKVQRETTGDSALGRWITTVLRTGKMGYAEFKKLMAATHKMGRKHRAAALKFLDKHGFHVERRKTKTKHGRFDYGKATNKKAVRRQYTRKDGGPR